jgi:hypothetical protein
VIPAGPKEAREAEKPGPAAGAGCDRESDGHGVYAEYFLNGGAHRTFLDGRYGLAPPA